MHSQIFVLAFCVICTTVNCQPNAAQDGRSDDTYLDIVREIVDELGDEHDWQYRDTEDDTLEQARTANDQEKTSSLTLNGQQYTETELSYLQLARQVADRYMQEKEKENEEYVGTRTVGDSLHAFNRQSRRTQMIAEQNERQTAELATLRLLASNENSNMLRAIDFTAQDAQVDPTCYTPVDCNDEKNLKMVDEKEFRTIDGTCNNKLNYTWGMAGAQHRRLLPGVYKDEKWEIDTSLPVARSISNAVHNTTETKPENVDSISLGCFYFMQFIDHDLAKTPEGNIGNKKCCKKKYKPRKYCMPLFLGVKGDDHFKRNNCIQVARSFTLYRCNDDTGFRNQMNEITSYMDGSMVYGSSKEEETTLRTYIAGLLKESTREFLPNSTRADKLPCKKIKHTDNCYEAGDTRANVHPGLISYHTHFVREHNRIATELLKINKGWSDERIYQETRKIIGAEIQHIVYTDMLPVLIQEAVLTRYGVRQPYIYKDSVDASMSQGFSIAYRYHNLMPDKLKFGELDGSSINIVENIDQERVFENPSHITRNNYNGIKEVTLGMVKSKCPKVDRLMNNASRNLLFEDEEGNSVDLAALNIMRGRDWGMQGYTAYRAFCGLGNATEWDHLKNTTDEKDITAMKKVYSKVTQVDLWVGVVTERKLPGSISGATQSCLLAMHFANLKHGDRFWYEKDNLFTPEQLKQIKKTTLARVLCDNLDITLMRENVFRTDSEWTMCSDIKSDRKLELSPWKT